MASCRGRVRWCAVTGAGLRLTRVLPWVSLVAAVVLTASGEYALYRACGFAPGVAWAGPVAVDAYVVAALRMRRDELTAIAVMAAANGTVHLLPHAGPDTRTRFAVAVLAALVLWRVHRILHLGVRLDAPKWLRGRHQTDAAATVTATGTASVGASGTHAAAPDAPESEPRPAGSGTHDTEPVPPRPTTATRTRPGGQRRPATAPAGRGGKAAASEGGDGYLRMDLGGGDLVDRAVVLLRAKPGVSDREAVWQLQVGRPKAQGALAAARARLGLTLRAPLALVPAAAVGARQEATS